MRSKKEVKMDDGLGFSNEAQDVQYLQEVQNVQKAQKAQEAQDVQKAQDVLATAPAAQEVFRPYGTTQGRKGQKAKRINMAFSDINHTFITHESRKRGISATAFVNAIIDLYRLSDDGQTK